MSHVPPSCTPSTSPLSSSHIGSSRSKQPARKGNAWAQETQVQLPATTLQERTTSTSDATSMANRGLPIELLEMIFAFLPMNDLLRFQRVSKQWRAIIPGASPELNEILFLKSSHSPVVARRATMRVNISSESDPETGEERHIYAPELFTFVAPFYSLSRHPLLPYIETPVFEPLEDESLPRLVVTKEANHSWRDMFISMPPVKRISIRWGFTHDRVVPDIRHRLRLENDSGIRMNDFVEGIQDQILKEALIDPRQFPVDVPLGSRWGRLLKVDW
ncbi:hypothetical protein BCR34DRAFT_608610 [Clohesyomyces aquaticus]|uniref:F-box domain-containing protein n=1 Tax=Clohesyomyces aquaticus TaxID=1231657 RepID=A0A1Y1Y5C8_9PLEO|nr:hypothetical protein BCR34DRAFT_608610 [Clohesyomyces aquaticus]